MSVMPCVEMNVGSEVMRLDRDYGVTKLGYSIIFGSEKAHIVDI